MKHKHITMMSIVVATLMLVSLFAVVTSPTSVSGQASGTTVAANLVGQTMTGTGPAASVEWAPNWQQTDIFAVDTSGTLWHTPMNGNWDSLGGVCTASPASVSWGSTNRVDVFVRGSDGAVWQRSYDNNAWSTWTSLGGQLAPGTGPAVSSWGEGRLDVFVQGTDGALWHKAWTGTSWSNWQSLGGKLTASPAATKDSNMIDVFVRGTDGAVWQKYWSGTAWSSWRSLSGRLAPNTGPAVLGGIGVFVQGTDHQLWWQNFGEAGSAWSRLPACPEVLSASSPAVIFNPHGHTVVFVSTTSGNLMSCSAWATGWEWYSETSPP
jgi:hypothetical protein